MFLSITNLQNLLPFCMPAHFFVCSFNFIFLVEVLEIEPRTLCILSTPLPLSCTHSPISILSDAVKSGIHVDAVLFKFFASYQKPLNVYDWNYLSFKLEELLYNLTYLWTCHFFLCQFKKDWEKDREGIQFSR